MVVGVKLSSGAGSIHEGGPGGKAAAGTCKSRLLSREETYTISRQPVGRIGGTGGVGPREVLFSCVELCEISGK